MGNRRGPEAEEVGHSTHTHPPPVTLCPRAQGRAAAAGPRPFVETRRETLLHTALSLSGVASRPPPAHGTQGADGRERREKKRKQRAFVTPPHWRPLQPEWATWPKAPVRERPLMSRTIVSRPKRVADPTEKSEAGSCRTVAHRGATETVPKPLLACCV